MSNQWNNLGWNLFTGGHTFKLFEEEIINKLQDKGSWRAGDYIELMNELILEHGKPEPDKKIEDYVYDPTLRPSWWNVKYESIGVMLADIEASSSFKRWDKTQKRHYVWLLRGIGFEIAIGKANPTWIKTDDFMDYMGGLDFIDHENKELISVKCGVAVRTSHIEKINNFFKTNPGLEIWNDYNVKIVWGNINAGQVTTIQVGKVKDLNQKMTLFFLV